MLRNCTYLYDYILENENPLACRCLKLGIAAPTGTHTALQNVTKMMQMVEKKTDIKKFYYQIFLKEYTCMRSKWSEQWSCHCYVDVEEKFHYITFLSFTFLNNFFNKKSWKKKKKKKSSWMTAAQYWEMRTLILLIIISFFKTF